MDKVKDFIKKLGFTDKYLLIASIGTGIFAFCGLAVFTFTAKDPILYVTAAFTFLGTLAGFVVSKNKAENVASIQNTSNQITPDLTDNTAIQEGDKQ